MSTRFHPAVGCVIALFASAAASAQGLEGPLSYIGQYTLPTTTTFEGIQFGGLSGIDFDARDGSYWAISDDRSQFGPARFHNLSLDYTRSGFSGVTINSQTFMQTPGGGNFPALQVDPEAIRFDQSTGNFFWASEGERTASVLQNPFVREMNSSGEFVRELATPSYYNPTFSGKTGIRRNLAFESLTLSTNGLKVYAATENALFQDGPEASPASSTLCRVLGFDKATGAATNEFLYQCDAVAFPPIPAGSFATSGLVEMLAISDTEFLTVERSFSNGVGFNIKVFLSSIVGATDINGLSTAPAGAVTMSKKLVLDLGTLGITLDNIEGISFGKVLENGNRSLVLVSDNNFNGGQFTQFLAFEIVPTPGAIALLGLAGLVVRRRR